MGGLHTLLALAACAAIAVTQAKPPDQNAGQNRGREFGPRACGPADPSHIRVASETGGQPFFLSPTEIDASTHIMRETSLSDSELILWASAVSEGAPVQFTIPIDSSIRRFTISASFDRQGGTMNVIAADGTVNPRPPASEETILNCAHVLTIDKPAAGAWQARIVATGRFWLVVRGRSELSLMTAEFVRVAGRPGHEGLFRIPGQPIAGKPATLRTRVNELPLGPRFQLISAKGQVLQQLVLETTGAEEFVGSITLPEEPFRVAATGTDAAGLPYQRLYSGLFHAESVELSTTADETLPAGSSTAIPILVRNHGPNGRFQIVAVDGRGRLSRVEPQVLDLAKGAEATVNVWITVAAEAAPGTSLNLTVTATSEGSAERGNSLVRQFTVGPAR
jgi:hypothetical protein